MPTDPFEPILYRELSIVEAKDVIEIASPLLKELVNHATNTLIRCAQSLPGEVDEDLAILTLYRHIIEMTDGIEVLISQACTIPAIPLLRSSFEALLSIEYILEDDKFYVQRSLSWLMGYVHQKLDYYERLDPASDKGKEFYNRANRDFLMQGFEVPEHMNLSSMTSNLQSFLEHEHIKPIKEALEAQRPRNWFQLYNGPADLYQLAGFLKRGGQYEQLYRYWSRVTHSQDFSSFIARDSDGDAAIGRLRTSNELRNMANFAASFQLGATRLVLKKARPDEDLSICGTNVK